MDPFRRRVTPQHSLGVLGRITATGRVTRRPSPTTNSPTGRAHHLGEVVLDNLPSAFFQDARV
jgi:hypothetical protein